LGPEETANTVTYRLSKEFENSSEVIAESLNSIKTSSSNLVTNSKTIQADLEEGKNQISDFSNNINDYDQSASDYTEFVIFLYNLKNFKKIIFNFLILIY